jgi:hypothetical protein
MFSSNNTTPKTIHTENGSVLVYPLAGLPNYSVQIVDSIETIKEQWDSVSTKNNLFLQSSYLQLLERFPPEKMSFRYLLFYHNSIAIGISYNQVFRISIEDSMQQDDASEIEQTFCIVTAVKKAVKNWFIKKADFNLLINGNMLLTGAYGFYFKDSIDSSKVANLLQVSLEKLQSLKHRSHKNKHSPS